MSLVSIQVELPPPSQALIARFAELPNELPQAIARGMDAGLHIVAGRIIQERLSGKGPFPPEQHRLGEVTGELIRRTDVGAPVVRGNEITGSIGAHIIYASVHEFGGGKGGATPARAPFQTGIREHLDLISDEIDKELVTTATNFK